jgi:FlaA1/EpsC-like NDP-sugar epimerase
MGIVRYTGIQDALRVLLSIIISTIALYLVQFYIGNGTEAEALNNSMLILYSSFSFLFLLGYRVAVKQSFIVLRNYRKSKRRHVEPSKYYVANRKFDRNSFNKKYGCA